MASIIKQTSRFSSASEISEADRAGSDFQKGFAGGGAEVENKDVLLIKKTLPSTVSNTDIISVDIDEGNVTEYLADNDTADAVLRVSFSKSDPYIPYVNSRMFIQGSTEETNNINTFSGIFDMDNGNNAYLIKKHLIGQPLQSLAKSLQAYNGVRAQVLNGAEFLSTDCLKQSPVLDATERWAYFFKSDDCSTIPDATESLKNSISYYYTTASPGLAQNVPNQSLGGFISTTKVHVESTLKGVLSFYDLTLEATDTELTNFAYLQIGDEIIQVSSWSNGVANILERNAFGTPLRYHPAGTKIIGFIKNRVFDTVFNEDNAQYRCFVIRNDHATEVARNMKVFFKLASRNNLSNNKFAIEIPRSEKIANTASSGSKSYAVTSDLAGVYEDDHFATATMTFSSGSNSGQIKIIASYEGSTGTFFFAENFPYDISDGDAYIVDTSPAQLISSGDRVPVTGVSQSDVAPFLISDFSYATFTQNGVDINVDGLRTNGSDLHPGDVVYLWVSRELDNSNEYFLNNRMIPSISYNRV